jgi:tripartite-type tricarboxylate transporter receptor subunit TctC
MLLIDAQSAGGPADREARLYAKKMSGYFGQNFVIDSKPGAGTTIASGCDSN